MSAPSVSSTYGMFPSFGDSITPSSDRNSVTTIVCVISSSSSGLPRPHRDDERAARGSTSRPRFSPSGWHRLVDAGLSRGRPYRLEPRAPGVLSEFEAAEVPIADVGGQLEAD